MDKPPFEENYERELSPIARRLNEARWENARVMTLGGAGLSAALVFLLIQIGIQSCELKVSFFCASLAIPVWLALWQFGEAYAFYGADSHGHFAKPKGSGIGVILFGVGGLLLLFSFAALIWSISIVISMIFTIVSFLMIIFIFNHSKEVREYAETNDSDEV